MINWPTQPTTDSQERTIFSVAWWIKLFSCFKQVDRLMQVDNHTIIRLENGQLSARLPKSSAPGGVGGGTSVYNGQFKVIKSDTTYKVINGLDTNSPYCGYVILPDNTSIPVLVKDSMTSPICYIVTHYDGSAYVAEISETGSADPQYDSVQLATWNSGYTDALQLWERGAHYIDYRWL